MEKQAISIKEASQQLGISLSSAYEAANSGELPIIRIGKRILVPVAALEKMLSEIPEKVANENK